MCFTLTTGEALEANRLVKPSGANVVYNTATATDDPIAVTKFRAASGANIGLTGMNEEEPVELTAAGSFDAGVDLFAAAAGKVQKLPTAPGTYRRVAKSLEPATADGDIKRCLLYNDGKTTTVS